MDAFFFCLDCKQIRKFRTFRIFSLKIGHIYVVEKIIDEEAPRASDFAPGLETKKLAVRTPSELRFRW